MVLSLSRRWLLSAGAAGVVIVGISGLLLSGALLSPAPRPSATTAGTSVSVLQGFGQIQRSGNRVFVAFQSRSQLAAGDSIRSGPESRLQVQYPDGSVSRLDSGTEVRFDAVPVGKSAGTVRMTQAGGHSWHTLLKDGPDIVADTPAGVRATAQEAQLELRVDSPAPGQSSAEAHVWTGAARLINAAGSVNLKSGMFSRTLGGVPSDPAAIPAEIKVESFTLLNQTLDRTPGRLLALAAGEIGSAAPYYVTADGLADLVFTLGAPATAFELAVLDPSRGVFTRGMGPDPTVSVIAHRARAGAWSFRVDSVPAGSVWWVAVARAIKAPQPLDGAVAQTGPLTIPPAEVQDVSPPPPPPAVAAETGSQADNASTTTNQSPRPTPPRGTPSTAPPPPPPPPPTQAPGTPPPTAAPVYPPVVVSVSPGSGRTAGGTQVVITGSFFNNVVAVSFGGVGAGFTAQGPNQIAATAPPHAAGTVAVSVTTNDGTGTGGAFTYTVPQPQVGGVSPGQGPIAGGTQVVITGSGFTGAQTVTFGGVAGSILSVSDNQITARTPAHAAGGVDVRVNGPGGTSNPATFTYV